MSTTRCETADPGQYDDTCGGRHCRWRETSARKTRSKKDLCGGLGKGRCSPREIAKGESNMAARHIKAIDATSVHKICSGQVILDPSSALKELVENALDAGGTKIEVRLKECGLDMLEVIDNGSGIKPEDYAALAGKHTTSKLAGFDDLRRLSTFGFRGEALSSLCAISASVVIQTRTAEQLVGTKLVYDKNGELESTESCAREVGTTVTLTNLFESLPVRHKDFHKNKPREFQRLVRKLQQYAIINNDTRFVCSNTTAKSRTPVLSTQGSARMLDCVTSIFGSKHRDMLQPLNFDAHDAGIKVEGLISKAAPACGLSSGDRQMFFLNKRPVDVPKLAKAINEVYRQYNMHQYPIYFLNVSMATSTYDVNVTPDKRQIMFHDESSLVEVICQIVR
jgi:DNA mismatch repair protein PMS2